MAQDNQTQDPYDIFQTGDKVKHPKFGEGTVMQRTGSGDSTKLVVSFTEEGEKYLMAKYAKLRRLQPIEAKEEKHAPKIEEKPQKPKALHVDDEEEVASDDDELIVDDDLLDDEENIEEEIAETFDDEEEE